MDRERTTDQILRVQLAPGAKGRATGGSRGARRTPGQARMMPSVPVTPGERTRGPETLYFLLMRVHTDVFMKVYWYSVNSVTTMVVTQVPGNAQDETECNCGKQPGLLLAKYLWGFGIAGVFASSSVSPPLVHNHHTRLALADTVPRRKSW